MYAKYFHGDMAFQTKVVFLGLPVYNSVDMDFSALPGFKSPFHGDGQSALNPGTTVLYQNHRMV